MFDFDDFDFEEVLAVALSFLVTLFRFHFVDADFVRFDCAEYF